MRVDHKDNFSPCACKQLNKVSANMIISILFELCSLQFTCLLPCHTTKDKQYMALYVCTTANYRFVGMASRRKPEQKGSQPNATTRRSRTHVSAALGAPPAAATMSLAFEDAEEKQAILHGATESTRSAWENEYFRSFRMTHGLEWDSVHWEMWMSAAQPQHPTSPKTFPSAGSSFHGKGGARPRIKHSFAFNRGEPCSAKTCGFRHVCKRCGGNHPFVRCASGMLG